MTGSGTGIGNWDRWIDLRCCSFEGRAVQGTQQRLRCPPTHAPDAMADQYAARRRLAPLRGWAAAGFTLDTRSLAIFRIGLGCILIADCLLRTRDFRLMFTPDGIFPLETLARYHDDPSDLVAGIRVRCRLVEWRGAGSGGARRGGPGGRLPDPEAATILAWVALVSVIRRTSPAINAGDIWFACQLFWAMFLPLGARWSLDSARLAAAQPGRPCAASVRSLASAALRAATGRRLRGRWAFEVQRRLAVRRCPLPRALGARPWHVLGNAARRGSLARAGTPMGRAEHRDRPAAGDGGDADAADSGRDRRPRSSPSISRSGC